MNRENRKQNIAELHRQNILAAAERLFIEKGYNNTTMDDISHAADYSKRTVYSYFESKYEIHCRMVLQGITLLKEYIEQGANASDEFLGQYHGICTKLLQFYSDHPFYFDAVIQFQTSPLKDEHPPQIVIDIYNKGEETNALLEQAFESWQRQGVLRPDIRIKEAIFIYWSSLTALIHLVQQKEIYIEKAMGITGENFLNYSFDLLLGAILKTDINLDEYSKRQSFVN